MKNTIQTILLAITLPLFTISATADSAESIKTRMKDRIPALALLKQAQSVGENNKGLLEVMPGKKLDGDKTQLINGENKDRLTVYAIIAKKTGSTAASVGGRRAIAIEKSARTGTKVQTTDGTWRTK